MAGSKKWDIEHKNLTKIYHARSQAKSFVKNMASARDLEELQTLLDEKKEVYKTQRDQLWRQFDAYAKYSDSDNTTWHSEPDKPFSMYVATSENVTIGDFLGKAAVHDQLWVYRPQLSKFDDRRFDPNRRFGEAPRSEANEKFSRWAYDFNRGKKGASNTTIFLESDRQVVIDKLHELYGFVKTATVRFAADSFSRKVANANNDGFDFYYPIDEQPLIIWQGTGRGYFPAQNTTVYRGDLAVLTPNNPWDKNDTPLLQSVIPLDHLKKISDTIAADFEVVTEETSEAPLRIYQISTVYERKQKDGSSKQFKRDYGKVRATSKSAASKKFTEAHPGSTSELLITRVRNN